MTRYEIKKLFSTAGSRLALLLLLAILLYTAFSMIHDVSCPGPEGDMLQGLEAAAFMRRSQKDYTGLMDEVMLRRVVEENARLNAIYEDKAVWYKTPFSPVRDLISWTFVPSYRDFDYYAIDRLSPGEAAGLYERRVALVRDYLQSGEGARLYSRSEAALILRRMEALETPAAVGYTKGWDTLIQSSGLMLILASPVLAYLVSGLFSQERALRADAIFFSSRHGRKKAVAAKVKAGLLTVSALYLVLELALAVLVLSLLGTEGAGCSVQANIFSWRSGLYDLSFFEAWLLHLACGAIGVLFLALLTMLVSAAFNSTPLAAAAAFLPTLLTVFISASSLSALNRLLYWMPEGLFLLRDELSFEAGFLQLGSLVWPMLPVLMVFYGLICLALPPCLYQIYRKKQPC